MDSKQAAETLRTMCLAADWSNDPVACDACDIGIRAIEMLEWLFEYVPSYSLTELRILSLRADCPDLTQFRAYCEARFRDETK